MKKNCCRKLVVIIFLVLLICPPILSQNFAKNWVFGDFGLEFQADTVIVRHDYASHESRGMGIISDEYGNLLCYTNGLNIWNREHNIMPNGQNILSVTYSSKMQESIIIPKPGSKSEYYVFTVDAYNGQSEAGLYYSIVDLNLDNGLGDVTVKAKKILNQTTNRLTAVFHNNQKDVWIITNQHNTNSYYAYLLSESGLTETPVISSVGKTTTTVPFDGQLKASPDGSKVACSYGSSFFGPGEGFGLFDFDNSTGKLSNPLLLNMPLTYYGCSALEFSPDAKKLFVCQIPNDLYQFDISSGEYNKIIDSGILFYYPSLNAIGQMQLAPDGKIYITKGGGQQSGTVYLGVIENPNESGFDCIAKEQGLYLDGGSSFVAQTPNFIQNYFFKTSFTFSNACCGNLTDFRITNEMGLDSVKWDFGQGSSSVSRSPQLSYSKAGEYTVTLRAYYPEKTDTIRKQITIYPSPHINLGNDTTVCYGYNLSVNEGFKSYLWNTGDNTRSINITKPGMYKLTVENEYGCQTSDSVYLNIAKLPVIEIADSIQIGTLDSIMVSAGNFKSYYWSTGETTSSIYIKNEGWYSVTVENETGCTATKSFYAYIEKSEIENPDDWKLLNPQPSASAGLDVCFLNNQIGYILNNSRILATSDGGTTWNVLMEITSGKRMKFKNNYGYIIGDYGTIYKSTYMGGGWNKLNTGFTDNLTGLSVISEDTVIVTGANKLYVSHDGGENWNTLNVPDNNITDSYFTGSTVGHIGYQNGSVYKTMDGGNTWSLKSSVNSSSSNINRIYFVDDNTGFISRGYMAEILKTTDVGETWEVINSSSDVINNFYFLDTLNGFMTGEYGVIFKTTNGGAEWEWIGFQNGRYGGTDMYALYFMDNMTGFVVGSGGRIMKTTNGGKIWNGYATTYNTIRQLQCVSDTTAYGLVGNSFIKTTDGGNKWENIGAPVSGENTNQFVFVNENIGYCIAGGDINTSASVGSVFKTTNGGQTWIATNGGKELMNDNLYSIGFVDEKTGYVSGGYNDMATFKTTNGGNTWTRINKYRFGQIQFINSSIGYARNTGYYNNTIYKTIDGGENWIPVFEINTTITNFHFLDENNGYLVGNSSLMYKTTDGGTTWQEITAPYGYFVNMKFYSPNIGYITEDYGQTYQTSNGGLSWKPLNKPYNVTGLELFGQEIFAYGGDGVIMKKKVEYDPVVLTSIPASKITNRSATIAGNAASNNKTIKNIRFEYGIKSLSNRLDVQPDSVQLNESVNFSAALTNLEPNQTYMFMLSATADNKLYSSEIRYFTTLPDYEIYMNYVYDVSCENAIVSGNVIANANDITDIEFQYSTDTQYNLTATAQPNFILGGTNQIVTASLNALKPQSTYNVRIKANYQGKEIFSRPVSFYTKPTYEIAVYSPYIVDRNAYFRFYIAANKDTIKDIIFEYGTTREYENQISALPSQVNKSDSHYFDQIQLTELDPTAVYYYRIKANMGGEVIYSSENILNLQRNIVMIPIEPKPISKTSVQLQGMINPGYDYLYNIKFQYGTTEDLENSVAASPNSIYNFTTYLISATLHDLTPNVKYFARISAENFEKKYYSDIFTFTLSDSFVGLNDIDNKILIYPNPATDFVFIKSVNPISKVEVYDSLGKLLLITKNENIINVSRWTKGVYFIRIFVGGKFVNKKIIKN